MYINSKTPSQRISSAKEAIRERKKAERAKSPFEKSQEQLALGEMQRKIQSQIPDAFKGYGAIVGTWIWFWFPEGERFNALKAMLFNLGFRYSRRWNAYQHPCGDTESGRAFRDPRRKYLVRPLGNRPLDYQAKEYTDRELEEMGCPF